MVRRVKLSKFGIIAVLCLIFHSIPVAHSLGHPLGFEWGVAPGDKGDFHLEVMSEIGEYGSFSDDIYTIVNGPLPDIPWLITDITHVPIVDIDYFWANGSSIDLADYLGAGVALPEELPEILAVPIGNWNLLTSVVEAVTVGLDIEVVNETDVWGGFGELNTTDNCTRASLYYYKSDGMVFNFSAEVWDLPEETLVLNVTLSRIGKKLTDINNPTINSPDDIEYIEGETGNSITWSPSDRHPDSYEVFKNGTTIMDGKWNSTKETITVDIDGLSLGTYNYTIKVSDTGGNSVTDEVLVAVIEETAQTSTTTTTTTTETTSTTTTDTTTTSEPTDTTTTTSDTTTDTGDFTEMLMTLSPYIAGGVIVIGLLCLIRSRK